MRRTTSSHERKNQPEKQTNGKSGTRQGLIFIDGHVPLCIRTREEMIKEPEKVKGSSEETNEGSGSRERTREQAKSENEANGNVRRMMGKVTFVVLQKNTRSLNSSGKKTEELIREVQDCRWDALMLSETWRPYKAEIWKLRQGHVYMGAVKIENKHGVAILLNRKWRKINWTEYIIERAIATSITVNKQRITLTSDNFLPHGVCRPPR